MVMEQLLPRGFQVTNSDKVTRVVAAGDNWQIYMSSNEKYILAVKAALFETWCNEYEVPESLFFKCEVDECMVMVSNHEYLISSLDQGPYPEFFSQIDAFSISFANTVRKYPHCNLFDAIYIEQYSLILPTSPSETLHNNAEIFGKWITGGVNVSIYSFDRINQLMSWASGEMLLKAAQAAGFDVQTIAIDERKSLINEQEQNSEADSCSNDMEIKGTPFTLVGRPELERFFNENIIDVVSNQEKYKRMGIGFPGATILYGAPGCGKTYAVDKLTEYLRWKRFDIDSSTIASSYIHDTSKKISEVFTSAIKAAPSILVIDEMEAFLSDRSNSGPSGMYHVEEVAEFLRRIPEAISKGVLIFAMTNMIDSIDPAILRRGRFDHIIEVQMANAEEIEALLLAKKSELPISDDVNIRGIAESLSGYPMSDVAFVIREAGRFAVKHNHEKMNQECFEKAVDLLPKKKVKPKIGFVN